MFSINCIVVLIPTSETISASSSCSQNSSSRFERLNSPEKRRFHAEPVLTELSAVLSFFFVRPNSVGSSSSVYESFSEVGIAGVLNISSALLAASRSASSFRDPVPVPIVELSITTFILKTGSCGVPV